MIKNVAFLLYALLLFSCANRPDCSSLSEEEVQMIMQEISERNQRYIPLTEKDDTLMRQVVEYYKEYGTSSNLMEAYYLLGSVYRDLHEAPKAMQAFLEGISVADTLAQDCNYRMLAKLYTQKAELMDKQRLYRQAAEEDRKAYHYAMMGQDSVIALSALWSRLGTLYLLKDYRTASAECNALLEKSKEWGMLEYAAAQLIPCVLANLEIDQIGEARELIDVYEKYSGHVDIVTHFSVFPIYYYAKGRLLLAENSLDSAELFFRKELEANDWNNRQSAYRGLHQVFRKGGIMDSAYKYAKMQCEAVDSDYQTMVTTHLQNLHELYDYSRAEKENHQKSMQLEQEHQRMVRIRWTLVFVLLVALFVFYYLHARYEKKIARAELELEKAANEHEEAEYRLLELQKKLGLANSDEERAELEKEMQQAEEESALQRKRVLDRQEYLDELRRRVRLTKKDLRQRQFDEPLFRTLLRKSKEGQNATEQDYADMVTFLQKKDVGLVDRFYAAAPMATDMEFKVFLLMRMGMTKAEIATLTSHESNSISMVMNRFFKKVNKRNPESSAEADRWLLEI